MPDGQLALKTHRSSFVSAEDTQWLAAEVGTPSHFMTVATGFGAACLVHSEMNGFPAMQITAITDGHYVTVESMQAYKPVLVKLGLQSDVEGILRRPTFRQIVKDANQRSNAIFS